MDEYEYMWLPRWIFPQYFVNGNQIEHLFINKTILVVIRKGMYGLPQAGQFAYIALIKYPQLHGHTCAGFTPGLFKHETQDTFFSLVVDYFVVTYIAKNDASYLINTLNKIYPGINIDCSRRIILAIHLYWDYTNRTVSLSMPNYVNKALSIFQHKKPKHHQYSPHPHATPNYGTNIRYAHPSTTSNLTESQIVYFQQFLDTFLL